nr:hypothetical protein [Tanacetum cinerariifolium]
MPYDEIMSISGDDDNEANSDKEISMADENEDDKIIDEVLTKVKTEVSTSNATVEPITEVPTISTIKPTHTSPMADIQKLVAKVYNLGKFMLDKFVDSMDSDLPRLIADALEERLHELLSDTLKTQSPQLLIEVKVPNDFLVVNAKNLVAKVNQTSTDINEMVGMVSRAVQLMETSPPPISVVAEGEKDTKSIEEQPVKKLKVMMDIPIPVPLNSLRPKTVNNISFNQFTAQLFGSGPSQYTSTAPQSRADKGNGIA